MLHNFKVYITHMFLSKKSQQLNSRVAQKQGNLIPMITLTWVNSRRFQTNQVAGPLQVYVQAHFSVWVSLRFDLHTMQRKLQFKIHCVGTSSERVVDHSKSSICIFSCGGKKPRLLNGMHQIVLIKFGKKSVNAMNWLVGSLLTPIRRYWICRSNYVLRL